MSMAARRMGHKLRCGRRRRRRTCVRAIIRVSTAEKSARQAERVSPRKNPIMKPRTPRDRLLHRRVHAFVRALPEARGGDAAAVHKARVASRRLREALPVVLANAPAKKAKRL